MKKHPILSVIGFLFLLFGCSSSPRARIIKQADAGSFMMLEKSTDSADSKDNEHFFLDGVKTTYSLH